MKAEVFQSYSRALQGAVKAFEQQQKALIAARQEPLAESTRACEAALSELDTARGALTEALQALGVDRLSELPEDVQQQNPHKLLLKTLVQQTHRLVELQKGNGELLAQARHLNQETLEHLIALHHNAQPAVYGDQGQNQNTLQEGRSAYDFSA